MQIKNLEFTNKLLRKKLKYVREVIKNEESAKEIKRKIKANEYCIKSWK